MDRSRARADARDRSPVRPRACSAASRVQKPADFSLGWILKNPMAIMMVVMVLFVFILPKMIDPESMKEMQKEMQQMQQQQRQASPSPSGGTASDETPRQIASGARRRN